MTAGDRLSSTTLPALLPDRPSVPLSSLPEWTWGLTQQCKTNNTSARPSVFPASEQLTFHSTGVHVVTDSASPASLSFPHRPFWTKMSPARLCEAIWRERNISIQWVKALHVICFWSFLLAVSSHALKYPDNCFLCSNMFSLHFASWTVLASTSSKLPDNWHLQA